MDNKTVGLGIGVVGNKVVGNKVVGNKTVGLVIGVVGNKVVGLGIGTVSLDSSFSTLVGSANGRPGVLGCTDGLDLLPSLNKSETESWLFLR